VLENLARSEGRTDYIDRALIEYAAAGFHLERAGHLGFLPGVETNLGFLFYSIGRHAEAFEHLDRARRLYKDIGDVGRIATVEDTLARVLLAEGRYKEAAATALSAVNKLESGGEHSLLIESLTTYGKALARLQSFSSAESALLRAVQVGEHAGDLEGAGQAALTLLEELGERLGPGKMREFYLRSDELLARSEDAEVLARLRACARRLLDIERTLLASDDWATVISEAREVKASMTSHADAAEGQPGNWDGFSLKDEIHSIERKYIEHALRDAGGLVSHAARLLGFRHHESLASLLRTRHSDLLSARTPAKSRRRSIIKKVGH
jgi:tetratricopeptide (TPR) repeat protein